MVYLEIDQLRTAATKFLEIPYRINCIPCPIARAELVISLLKLVDTNTIRIRKGILTASSEVWARFTCMLLLHSSTFDSITITPPLRSRTESSQVTSTLGRYCDVIAPKRVAAADLHLTYAIA